MSSDGNTGNDAQAPAYFQTLVKMVAAMNEKVEASTLKIAVMDEKIAQLTTDQAGGGHGTATQANGRTQHQLDNSEDNSNVQPLAKETNHPTATEPLP